MEGLKEGPGDSASLPDLFIHTMHRHQIHKNNSATSKQCIRMGPGAIHGAGVGCCVCVSQLEMPQTQRSADTRPSVLQSAPLASSKSYTFHVQHKQALEHLRTLAIFAKALDNTQKQH